MAGSPDTDTDTAAAAARKSSAVADATAAIVLLMMLQLATRPGRRAPLASDSDRAGESIKVREPRPARRRPARELFGDQSPIACLYFD